MVALSLAVRLMAGGAAMLIVAACAGEGEDPTWWGNVRVVGSGGPPVLGGYTSAAIATGGWDDPRELGDCIVLGSAPGGRVHAGRLVMRLGDEFELAMPHSAGGYYLPDEIPESVELSPGLRIEAEAEGYEEIPAFRVETEYPPYLEDVVLPAPEAIQARSADLEVTWAPGPGGHRLGFSIDSGANTVACVADDSVGSLTVPAELMEVIHPDATRLLIKLTRCTMASVDEDGLEAVNLMACHTQGGPFCLVERPITCECAEGEEAPCYAI